MMTDSFLLVVAPWIIFGACLIALFIRLRWVRRTGERSSAPRPDQGDRHDQPEQEQSMRSDDNRRRRVTGPAGRS